MRRGTAVQGDHERPTLWSAEDAPSFRELTPGDLVDGRYRIERLIGVGGIGWVFRARHEQIGRVVALKVLAPQWASHKSIPERFRREAAAAHAVGHPAIVEVYDVGALPDGRPYVAMELVEGRSLTAYVQTKGRLDPRTACAIVRQVAEAAAATHKAGVIHRDLKPDNILLVEAGGGPPRVRVLDFGIAHVVGPMQTRITSAGDVFGTAEYMAPEQVRAEPPTPAVDVYALGAILFELLSGALPISRATALETLAAKTSQPAPSLATFAGHLPAPLLRLVDGCLNLQPSRRPTTRQLVDALVSVDHHLASDGAVPAARRRELPRAWKLGIAATLVGLVTGAGVVALAPNVGLQPATTAAAACGATVDAVDLAQASRSWSRVLELTTLEACLRPDDRQRLRTRAYLGLGAYAQCVEAGAGTTDPRVQSWVRLCGRPAQ